MSLVKEEPGVGSVMGVARERMRVVQPTLDCLNIVESHRALSTNWSLFLGSLDIAGLLIPEGGGGAGPNGGHDSTI